MSDRYDRGGSSRRRGVFSHWVPLVLTVTVATIGVAAWVWSQRSDEEDDNEPIHQDLDYDHADYGDNPAYGASRDHVADRPAAPSFATDPKPGEAGYGVVQMHDETANPNAGWGAKMSGALRRTPSPHQLLGNAGKTVAAGVAAAGAAVGSALASIREDDKNAYADHETWSEEADAKKAKPAAASSRNAGKKRKVVAIVVSADSHNDDVDQDGFHEHAVGGGMLSGQRRRCVNSVSVRPLPHPTPERLLADQAVRSHIRPRPEGRVCGGRRQPPAGFSELVLLEYRPRSSPVSQRRDQEPLVRLPQPGPLNFSLTLPPRLNASANPAFQAVYSQAVGLVEKENMILPFSSANGYVHILHHLQPEVVYLQESLAGDKGNAVTQLQAWLRHDIVLVVGAESGAGGLADSESEAEKPGKPENWWQREDRVGRGRGVVVVDGMRVHDDWARRVQKKD